MWLLLFFLFFASICSFLLCSDIEAALGAARAADSLKRRVHSHSELGVLHGIPVAIKDNFCVRGARVRCGSAMLRNFEAPYTATAVARLQEHGAILLGRTNMDEFGMGSSTSTGIDGVCRNPHAATHSAGGSSGGSGAAVASGAVMAALGSDTGWHATRRLTIAC